MKSPSLCTSSIYLSLQTTSYNATFKGYIIPIIHDWLDRGLTHYIGQLPRMTFWPCIMCVQYREGCSVPWGVFSTVGEYHEYRGGISWVPWGDIMINAGGYLEYRGGCSVPWGYHKYRGGLSWVPWGMFSTVGISWCTWGISWVLWGCSVPWGIPSFEIWLPWGYHDARGGISWVPWGCSVSWVLK